MGHYYKNTGITAVDPLPVGLELIKNNYLDYKANHIHGQSKGVFNYKKLIELLREEIPDIDKYKENEKTHRIAVGKNSVMKLTVSTVQGTIGIRLASVTSNNKWVTGNMDFLC